jgi:WD40 repeat protein
MEEIMRRLILAPAALILILLAFVSVWSQSPYPQAVRLARTFSDSTNTLFSADGRRLAVIATDGSISLVDLMTGHLGHALIGKKGSVYNLLWSGDNQKLAIFKNSGKEDWVIEVWNLGTGELRATIKVLNWEYQIRWGSNNDRLLIIGGKGVAQSWDAENGRLIAEFRARQKFDLFSNNGAYMAWSPDGRRDEVRFYDLVTMAVKKQWKKISVNPFSLNFSPLGKTIVTKAGFARESNIVLADAETGQVMARLPTNDFEFEPILFVDPTCRPVQVNHRGKLIVTQAKDRIRLWDSEKGQLIDDLAAAKKPAQFSPDGRWLATGSKQKNTMLLWEVIRN